MKKKFFNQLKKELIKHNEKIEMAGYYDLIVTSPGFLQQIFTDIGVNTPYNITYEEDNTGGYTNGKIEVHIMDKQSIVTITYELSLEFTMASLGWCECSPKDEGYNPVKDCCGVECDWYEPIIDISRTEHFDALYQNITQRQYWEVEKEWQKYVHESSVKQEEDALQKLNDMIIDLEKRKQRIIEFGIKGG